MELVRNSFQWEDLLMGLHAGCKRKAGIKNNSKFLASVTEELSSHLLRWERLPNKRWGKEIRGLFLDMLSLSKFEMSNRHLSEDVVGMQESGIQGRGLVLRHKYGGHQHIRGYFKATNKYRHRNLFF